MKNKLLSIWVWIGELFKTKPEIVEIQQAPTQLPLKVLAPVGQIPSIGDRNGKIVGALTKVREVTVSLARSGFHVIDISVSGRNPRIIINPCDRCEMLDGAVIKIIHLTRCEVRTMAASINGVQIEWNVPYEYE